MRARRHAQKLLLFGIVSLALLVSAATSAVAEDSSADQQIYWLGSAVETGTDTGYSETNPIKEGDPHFGWTLGRFGVSGFTSVHRDDANSPTFLKTEGDKVTLWFRLDQDINKLNGDDSLSIADDTNGYDQEFGIQRSESGFGHGTLIIRQTDYQNAQTPQVYTNYLDGIEAGADTQVQLFEEGDYEVALDYEVKSDPRRIPLVNVSVLPTYTDYRIRINFSVRNGNTMLFLFDSSTGSELTNTSTTENGFTIDLARSRYLDINVKRETLANNGEDFVEDTRFNGPARDGQIYTEPGIYTITASNPSTGQSTEKKIYVGTDPVLRAYVTTGFSLDEIRSQISQGAQVDANGSITWPEAKQAEDTPSSSENANGDLEKNDDAASPSLGIVVALAVIAALVLVGIVARRRSRSRAQSLEAPKEQSSTDIVVTVEPDDDSDGEGDGE